jgi:prephenate dehydrogenase
MALKTVIAFWEALGARVGLLEPWTHDRVVAAISHLPHAVAAALVEAAHGFEAAALDFAARGFKDTTRIAAGDPQMWQEIFRANREPVLASLRAFRAALAEIEDLIEAGDAHALEAWLAGVKARREALP